MNPSRTPPQSLRSHKDAPRLTRDKRIQVKTLAHEGLSYNKIAERLEITHRQVRHAMNSTEIIPKNSRGTDPFDQQHTIAEVKAYITSSPQGRQMPFFEVSNLVFPQFGVSEKVIDWEMKKRGYTRRIAASKPPLSPENLRKRYDFVRNHLHWEKEDLIRVFWTDES